jgi:hypothetical protein
MLRLSFIARIFLAYRMMACFSRYPALLGAGIFVLTLQAAPLLTQSSGPNALQNTQTGSQHSEGSEALTNADVIRMVRAHLSVDIILEQIRSHRANFSLTTDSLIKLKEAGVPDAVIFAMQTKAGDSTGIHAAHSGKESSDSPPAEPHPDVEEGKWNIRTKEDPITQEKTRVGVMARMVEDNGRRGKAEVTAICDDKPNTLEFRVAYFPEFSGDVNLMQSSWATVYNTLYRDRGVHDPREGILVDTIFGNSNETPPGQKLYVRFNVRIDSYVLNLTSTSNYQNQLQFKFSDGDNKTLGGTSIAYNAKAIRVQIPLSNGDTPAIDIDPQDPSFKEYAAGCSALH